jgi:hypothetical protein
MPCQRTEQHAICAVTKKDKSDLNNKGQGQLPRQKVRQWASAGGQATYRVISGAYSRLTEQGRLLTFSWCDSISVIRRSIFRLRTLSLNTTYLGRSFIQCSEIYSNPLADIFISKALCHYWKLGWGTVWEGLIELIVLYLIRLRRFAVFWQLSATRQVGSVGPTATGCSCPPI